MKKSILLFFYVGIMISFENIALARMTDVEVDTAVAEIKPACTEQELAWRKDKKYILTSGSPDTIEFIDTKTIDIDKKNKIIKVWTIDIVSKEARANVIQKHGYTYQNYGYAKSLRIYDYARSIYSDESGSVHNCNGYALDTFVSKDQWQSISPDSIASTTLDSIIKIYNLQ
jgi:hypothetical protein